MLEKLSKTYRKPGELNRLTKAVRLYCIQCFGGSTNEVAGCTSPDCQFWPYRFGSPKAARALATAEKKKKEWLTEEEAQGIREGSKETQPMTDEKREIVLAGLAKGRAKVKRERNPQ